MGATHTRWGLVTATAVAALTLVGLGPTGAAAAADRCEGGSGVTVVVDFGALGGGSPIVCVSDGGGRSAMDVVQDAGFRLDQVRTQPGFVCAINGQPDPATSCARTPPPDKYWGLFWSDGSSTRWSYASTGAGGLKVPSGGSIGWRWQNTDSRSAPGPDPTTSTPSSSPKPTPTKPPESPRPTPEPTKEPAATPPVTSGAPSPGGASATPPSGTQTAAEKAAEKAERAEKRADKRSDKRSDSGGRGGKERDRKAAAGAEGEEAGDAQVTSEAAVQEETPLDPASATDDGGGALTWAAGGAVLLLAAAAGVLARRRRG